MPQIPIPKKELHCDRETIQSQVRRSFLTSCQPAHCSLSIGSIVRFGSLSIRSISRFALWTGPSRGCRIPSRVNMFLHIMIPVCDKEKPEALSGHFRHAPR
jgi:hypothetical protein